ncbi:MAG: extracellular solute-binding protein [Planctomycetes bacterium]|nr:extracellular solute-binding protein [Planctomycetota bacterium]
MREQSRDALRRSGVRTRPPFLAAVTVTVVAIVGVVAGLAGCGKDPRPAVVLYCSLDEVYAEPVLRRFQERTGIEVRALYDSEATKTVGLAARLVAERARPQADVFWNSEILRTLSLASQGVLEPYRSPSAADVPDRWKDPHGLWTGFAARARVLVYDPGRVAAAEAPRSLTELALPRWKGQVGIARPQFGTTSTHLVALFLAWGPARAEAFCRALRGNDVRLLAGNSTVVDMVARGELLVGLTDTDDVWSALDEGKKVAMVEPDADGEGTLVIPNTLALVRGAPHPESARRLIDYLLSREVEAELARSRSRQMPVRDVECPAGVRRIGDVRALAVDAAALPAALDRWAPLLDEIFQ